MLTFKSIRVIFYHNLELNIVFIVFVNLDNFCILVVFLKVIQLLFYPFISYLLLIYEVVINIDFLIHDNLLINDLVCFYLFYLLILIIIFVLIRLFEEYIIFLFFNQTIFAVLIAKFFSRLDLMEFSLIIILSLNDICHENKVYLVYVLMRFIFVDVEGSLFFRFRILSE